MRLSEMLMNRREVVTMGGAALGLAGLRRSRAQEAYPARPITLVVPSAPAGVHDVIGRAWAERARFRLGTIVVDNRPGAGGLIATTEAAHAKPDGYTLLIGSTTTQVLITPALAKPPYDPFRDFVTIAAFATSSTSIVVTPSLPVTTLAEFIAYAKANPGKLSFGSAANGSITHLTGELFKKLAGGLDIVHVPYKGIGPAMNDLISGHIAMLAPNLTGQALPLSEAGKIRGLAVNAPARLVVAPQVPTSAEAGLPDMISQTTFAICAPAGLPKPIVDQLAETIREMMADQEFQQQLMRLGFEPLVGYGPEESERLFREQTARWVPIIRAVGPIN